MSGYEGEGTGGGWGNWGGRDDDAPGSGWSGKPGETQMAQAASQQNLTALSDRADTRNLEGWNEANPTQTVEQIEASQKVNDLLSWGAPMAMSAVNPALGLINTLGRVGVQLKDGVLAEDIAAGLLPGFINGKINQATGGLYGNVAKYGGILNSLTGSPQVPNIGREIVGGIMGNRPTPGAPAQAETSVASVAPDRVDGGVEATMARQSVPAAQPAPQDADVNYASLGIDSAGWTTAGRNYLEKRNGLV